MNCFTYKRCMFINYNTNTVEDLFHTSTSDFLLGFGVQVSSKPWRGRKDDSTETIAGCILYSVRLDGTVLYLFCLFGYL